MAYKMNKPVWHGTDAHENELKLNRSMDQSSLPDGRPKSSAFQKAGCAPGDPGCGGNFKVKKKGTVISRALNKAGRWVSSEVKDIKSNIRNKRVARKRKKSYYDSKGGSNKTVRYL